MIDLTAKQLRQAASIKEKIAALEKKLGKLLGSTGKPAAKPRKKRRKMSAAGRARISAAMKARWARKKAKK